MIVNPKEFNYRVIIGILVVTMVAFAAYGFNSYSTLKSNKDFLVQEKRHLHNELSEIIDRYDELNSENLTLKSQLDSTINEVRITDNAIKKLEAKSAYNEVVQNELTFLKAQKSSFENREDSLIKRVSKVEEKRKKAIQELNFEKVKKTNVLIEKSSLEKKVDKASLITANSFVAKAYTVKNSDKKIQTYKAKDTEQIELCFVLAENVLAPKEQKQLYIQIIDPDNNVLSDKGFVNFGSESLIFSKIAKVNYQNLAIDTCIDVKSNKAFKAGYYYINVFEDNRRLGSTKIQLN